MMQLIRKYQAYVSAFLMVNFLSTIAISQDAFAITGHDSMPEYRSFEPVATTNMVNMFDGSLNYNIPLINVPNGYPINLSYHSNEVNTNAQASWVGLGWTLNPGAINRVKRGFPDEFDGEQVVYHSKMPKNWTVSAGVGANFELFGSEKGAGLFDANVGVNVHYNNYNGVGSSLTGGLNALGGVASLHFNYSRGRLGFSPTLSPGALISRWTKKDDNKYTRADLKDAIKSKAKQTEKSGETKKEIEKAESDAQKTYVISRPSVGMSIGGVSAGYTSGGRTSFSVGATPAQSFPVAVTGYQGSSMRLQIEGGANFLPLPTDVEGSLWASYSEQNYTQSQSLPVYGYMHLEGAQSDPQSMMDYFTEKEKMFQKRDQVLGIPFPNNDLFSVSGEALGGTFRAQRNEFGHYRKNEVFSETVNADIGLDANVPIPVSPPVNGVFTNGTTISADYHTLKIGSWSDPGKLDEFNAATYFANSSEKFFLKFSSDLAAVTDFKTTKETLEEPVRASLTRKLLKATPNLNTLETTGGSNSSFNIRAEDDQRVNRSAYIGTSSKSDYGLVSEDVPYRVEEKNLTYMVDDKVYPAKRSVYKGNPLEEVYTYNKDGVRYVYGLPIHTRKEKQLNYSVEASDVDLSQGGGLTARIVNSNLDQKAKMKKGYESASDYATQFLLTQITSSDYIDKTFNGPSPDDFGSYTRINYKRVAGDNDWYNYRTPFAGANFNYGTLSSNKDDMVSISAGEKELFYIHSIVSKTHVAIFTTSDRADGFEANNTTINSETRGTQTLQRLDRIDLYALEDVEKCPDVNAPEHEFYKPKADAKPIKTVRFSYANGDGDEYTLCRDLPNNPNGPLANSGKLTLKRVWFEYQGIVKNMISPYEFEYAYPTTPYPNPYSGLAMNFNPDAQNPNYNELNSDAWGNYRDYGAQSDASRYGDLARFFPHVDQNPAADFDPAAYLLKQIKLPSGGRIDVQYEQNDYEYVQDQKAMLMVPLSEETLHGDEGKKRKRYYLDLAQVGIAWPSDPTARTQLLKKLFEPLMNERMYFKFLYSLVGDVAPDYKTINSEYIEGFTKISGFGFDNKGPYFKFKGQEDSNFTATNYGNDQSRFELPQKVCKEFYKTQRRGLISGAANSMQDDDDAESKARAVLSILSQVTGVAQNCMQIAPKMSFVRLQALGAKKGGGVRVKRLLMYDDGITNSIHDNVLYGTEYTYGYLTSDGVQHSYGVATNEPGPNRYESPLVKPIERDEQSLASAILYGRDMYNQDGPIGESLLPDPSVGYSKIKVNNIHQGSTSTGYEIHEFYTCKDFPFEARKTDINSLYTNPISASVGAAGISGSYSRHNPYMTQGYTIITNEMHGKPKRVAKYAADETNEINLAEQTFEYYELGDKVDVIDLNGTDAGTYAERKQIRLGVSSEVLAEIRQVEDITYGGSIGIDATTGAYYPAPAPVPPIPVVLNTISSLGGFVNEQILHTHVINKIVNYPAIVKRTINRADGVRHITENIAFDINTGDPVVTKAYDDFDQGIISQSYKASWVYGGMGSKARNEGLITSGMEYDVDPISNRQFLQFSDATGRGVGGCGAAGNFAEGDFIQVRLKNVNQFLLFHVSEVDVSRDRLYLAKSALSGPSSTANFPAVVESLEVLKSGFSNQLSANAGQLSRAYGGDGLDLYKASASVPQQVQNQFTRDLQTAFEGVSGFPALLTLNGPYEGGSVALDGCFSPANSTCATTADEGKKIRNVVIQVDRMGTTYDFRVKEVQVLDHITGGGGLQAEVWSDLISCDGTNAGTFDPYFSTATQGNVGGAGPHNSAQPIYSLSAPTNGGGSAPLNSGQNCNPQPNTVSTLDREHDPIPYQQLNHSVSNPCSGNGACSNGDPISKSFARVVVDANMPTTIHEYYGGAFFGSSSWYSTASHNPSYTYITRSATKSQRSCFPTYCKIPEINGPAIDHNTCYKFVVTGPTGRVASSGYQANNFKNQIHHLFVSASPMVTFGNSPNQESHREVQLGAAYTVEIYKRTKTSLSTNCSGPEIAVTNYNVIFDAAEIEDDIEITGSELTGSPITYAPLQYKSSAGAYWDVMLNFNMDLASSKFHDEYPIYTVGQAKTTIECIRVIDPSGTNNYVVGDYEWIVSEDDWRFDHNFQFRMHKSGRYQLEFDVLTHQGVRKTLTSEVFEYRPAFQCAVDVEADSRCFTTTNNGEDLANNSSQTLSFSGIGCDPSDGNYACWIKATVGSTILLNSTTCGPWNLSVPQGFVNDPIHITYGTENNHSGQTFSTTTPKVISIKDCRTPKIAQLIGTVSCPDKTIALNIIPTIGNPPIAVESYEWSFDGGTSWIDANSTSLENTVTFPADDCGPKTIQVRGYNRHADGFTKEYGAPATYQYGGNGSIECHPVCGCSSPITINNWKKSPSDFIEEVGEFAIDARTGEVGFTNADCPRFYTFDCIKFCPSSLTIPEPTAITEANVLSASAVTYDNEWEYDESVYYGGFKTGANAYEKGIKGKWRPVAQHVYRDNLIAATSNDQAGYFTLDLFDWATENNNPDKWVKSSTTTKYSPNGDPIEDKNILGIYSAAKFGYNKTLPIAVAQNSQEAGIEFQNFEQQYHGNLYWENGLQVDGDATWVSDISHTGKYAMLLQEDLWFDVGKATVFGEGAIVRMWVRQDKREIASTGTTVRSDYQPLVLKADPINGTPLHQSGLTWVMNKISSAGEWSLYEAQVNYTGTYRFKVRYSDNASSGGGTLRAGSSASSPVTIVETVHIDDVRIQPYTSEMVCYVYDRQQKLVATFDDQHFAQLYQYNAEGELVRKLKETREGVKTISETQYNTKKVAR